MTDSFGISDGNFDDSALVASRWTSGGNSAAARRARVKLQRRDKYGRWAEMGGGVSFPGKLSDGSTRTVIGRYVGPAKRDGYMRVEVTDPKAGVPKGVYEVNGRVATVSKAILTGEQLEEAGVKLDVNGKRIGENLDRDIEPFTSMYRDKTPDAAETHLVTKGLSDDEKKVEEKARLEADPHVSYNVVDENGNPVVEAPTPAKAQQPPKPKLQRATAAWLNSDSRKNGDQIFFTRRGSEEVIEGYIVDGYVYEGQIYDENAGDFKGLASIEELIDSQKNGSERGTVQAIFRGTAPLITDENGRTRKVKRADILRMENEQRQERAPMAQGQLPPEGPSGPRGPRAAVAVQKLAKDVDLGDRLIDTMGIESDPEKRHIAGVVEGITYDDANGTATFLINPGRTPDPNGRRVSITRTLMTPMGVDPQTSPNGGNNLSVEGNAAYERYMARRNPPQAQTPPSTPTPTPTPSEPSEARLEPSSRLAGLPDGMSKNPSDNMTLFNRANGDIHPIQVLARESGRWDVTRTNPQNGDVEVMSTHSRRGDAESEAIARISQEELSPTSEPTPEPSEQELVFQGRRGDGSGAFIDRTKLTAEQIGVLNNLLDYRRVAKSNLGTPPLAGNAQQKQEYEFKLALVDSIENAINNLEENTNLGTPEKSFVFGKTEDARTENLRIIPSSLRTEIARDPKLPRNTTVITEAKGIFISKTGAPYLLSYKDGQGTYTYRIIDGKAEGRYCGSVSVYSMLEGGSGGGNREDYKPNDASIGMIKVHDGREYDLVNGPSLQGQGIADYMIMMTRFVAQNHGRRFAHSNTLYAPGNIYGKRVSLNLEDQNRYQRDKALFLQAPDSPIIAALKASRRLGYSDTHWATQAEMKRRKLQGGANQSALWPIGRKINAIADDFRRQFKDNPNAQPGVDYPAIFERHVKSENGDWTDHDIQMQLLRTAYKEGMSKDQILAKLDEYIDLGADGKPWPRLFNDAATLIELRNNIANNPNWDAYERKPEPLGLVTDEVKFWDSPFTSGQKFTNFIVPKGMTPVRVGPTYVHRPNALAPKGSPADWTESPSELATRFSSDELVSSLRTAVLAKTNDVTLKFGGNQEGKVNSGSVYRALREQGQDAQKILADIYDEALGDGRTDNQDALSAYIAKQVDETEAFNQFLAQYGVERPVAFSQVNGIYRANPVFILHADMVRRIAADENSPSIVKVRPLASTNEPRTLLDGTRINNRAYQPNKSPEDWLLNGVTDDPKILAYNFSTEALGAALSDAIINNKTEVSVQFANNKTLQLPIHAIRDTLQHQGVNTESIFDNHSNYFKPEPQTIARVPGRHGVLDEEGNYVYELTLNGNQNKKLIGKFKNGETNLNKDGSSYTLVKNIDGVETPLAKIEKNAQGKYDVWYNTSFGQAPTMTFDSARVAIGNIADALVADGLFSERVSHIETMTEKLGDGNPVGARYILQNKKVVNVLDETSPADRPDLSLRSTYTIAGDSQVLDQNKRIAVLEISTSGSIALSDKDGSLGSVTKSGNFFVVKNSQGITQGTYSTQADAFRRLNLVASEKLKIAEGSLTGPNTVAELRGLLIFGQDTPLGKLSIGTGRGTVAIPRADADGGLRRIAVGRFENFTTREFDIVGYTNNKRQGIYRAGSNFEFLNLKLYNKEDNPDAGRTPVITADVVRIGRSEWRARLVFEDGRGQTKYIYRNDPLSAVDKLKEMLADAGITNDSVKFDDIVPKRTVSATANDQQNYQPPAPPAPAPAPAPAPVAQPRPGAPVAPAGVRDAAAARAAYALQPQDVVANPIDLDRVNRVLDRINNNIPDLSNTPAGEAQRLGGGVTAPQFLTLPNGLKIKVKTYARDGRWNRTPNDMSERLNINDVAVSALADLLGVNATPGGFALINGKKIIGDPIEPNVDRLGWTDVMASPIRRADPENAQAVEDFKRITVLNTLVAGGDWINNPYNFLVVKNPDGSRRLAICDGGRALIGGVHETDPVNNKFFENISATFDRYHRNFMAPNGGTEVFKGGLYTGVMTKDDFIRIAREIVLPLTPEVINKFAEIYQNAEDRRKFIDNLTRRRRELLDYLGIDDVRDRQAPLNAPSVPAAPQAPAAPSAPSARSVRTRAPRVQETDRTIFPQGGQPLTPAQALMVNNLRVQVVADSRGISYSFATGDDGKAASVVQPDGSVLNGRIKVRNDGSVVAIFEPNDLGKERNGNAELAIFRGDDAVTNAENFLSVKLHHGRQPIQNYFAAREDNKDDLPLIGRDTQQPQLIKKGFLNPTTDRQTSFARRLVEGKKMSDADRAKYRGVLNMSGLTVGEVGGIIDAIKDNEDRTASEIAESVARDQVVPANEVVDTPSDLANTPSRPSGLTKRAIDLIAGDRIITGGRVAFVHDRGNGKVDIGVVTREGKLNIVRNIDADLTVDLLPEVPNNQQMVGGNNAVNNFAGNANKTLDDIKNAYPGYEALPNGDLVIGKREFTDAQGVRHRYEAVVHRTADETFVGYVRQLRLAPNGNIVSTRAAAFTAPAHSSVAALNRLSTLFTGDGGPGSGMNGTQPNNWFNNLQSVAEGVDPRTGQLLPTYLLPDPNIRRIGNTGIESTGDGLKDALIAHVANLIDRGVLSSDVLQQVAGANNENFAVLSRHQFMDIIERIEARRANPGVNAIPYVSMDEKTIVREGDTVHHYDARGNRLTLPGGAEKVGKVVRRESLQVYEKAQGRYEYRDILWVKFDGRRQLTPIAARRLAVITRADGSPPLPAVNEPNAPQAPQAPQAPATPAAPNNDPLANAFTSEQSFGRDEVDAINNQVTLPFGMEARLSGNGSIVVRPQGGGPSIANIEPIGNGTYNVLTLNDNDSGLNITNHPTKLDAVNAMLGRINGGNQAPAAPAAPSSLDREVPSNIVNLPAGARVNTPEEAQGVQTLLDNEIPRNRYEVTRDSDGTKFVVITNNNLGAESFIEVQRTPNGWKAVDLRRRDPNFRTIYEGNDRRVAEMHAMNRITGADGGENPSPEAPAPARLMPKEIEIEGRGFRGVPSFNGNALTFYDDSGNEAATITRQADGRTFTVSEPFGGNIGITSSFDDAVLIAGRKIQDNIALGLMDESSEQPSSGPGTNLPPTPAPSTPESSAPSDIINGADGVAYTRDRGFDITTYSSPSGTNHPLRVFTPNGVTWTVDNNGQTVNIFGTREEAEAFAENLISGQPANLPATPAPSVPSTPEVPEEPRRLNTQQVIRMRDVALRELARLEQQYPDGQGEPDVIDIDPLDGVRKALPRSEFLRRKINQYNRRINNANQPANQQSGNVVPSQAPTSFPSPESADTEIPTSVPATPSGDTSLNALNVTLRGVKMVAQRDDTGFTTFDENGGEGAYAIANGDGTFSVYDPSTGENEVVDSEAEAVILAGAINFNNIRGGFHRPKDSSEPSAPSQPALPNGYFISPIGSGNNTYEVKHETDKENTPYYLVERGNNGNYYVSKWGSQNTAAEQRFRRPEIEQQFTTKEEANQWIANDLGPSDGGNGGGGNPPSEPPTTPPAGGNFATDRIPAGMSLQEKDRLNIIGPSGLQLGFNDVPNFQENRPKVYGYYSKVSEANGKYKAVIQGLPDGRAVLEFPSPEEAHNWVVENLRNFANPTPASPTPAPAAPTPAQPFNPVIPQGVIGKAAVRDWIQENYGDLDDVNKAIFGNYEEITPHLVDALNMKRAYDAGFTELGTLPRWGDPSFRQGGSLPDAGVNANRKIQLSDGTFAYLKHMGMGKDEAFNEVMVARLFEAVGVNDLVAVSVVDPRPPSGTSARSIGGTAYSVLTREIPGEMGEKFIDRFISQGSDAPTNAIKNLKNARELSLIDYLINNDDRHENNWIHKDGVAYPIDHGYAFNVNTPSFPLPTRYQGIRVRGNFRKPIEDWVRSADPKNNPLFTEEELDSIYNKIWALRSSFTSHSRDKRDYFDQYIMPRFDVLMGIWR